MPRNKREPGEKRYLIVAIREDDAYSKTMAEPEEDCQEPIGRIIYSDCMTEHEPGYYSGAFTFATPWKTVRNSVSGGFAYKFKLRELP